MVGDFYEDNPKNAWFISSFFGTILGLVATGAAWLMVGEDGTVTKLHELLSTQDSLLALGMFFVGITVSLNLRVYFDMLSCHAYTTRVAIAIAATPIFVFTVQTILNGGTWESSAIFSVLLTTLALIGFEILTVSDEKKPDCQFNWQLIVFLVTSTIYLVALDWLFDLVEFKTDLNGIQSSLIMMPFYWIGFALGITAIRHTSVRGFIGKVFSKWQFLLIAITLEIIGASSYFFEFMGIAEISATLVSLIVGAHIVFVWGFDIYLRNRYKNATLHGHEKTSVFFFKIPTENLDVYDISLKSLSIQGVLIVLVIVGIVLWPSL
jgi:hypothetical protein